MRITIFLFVYGSSLLFGAEDIASVLRTPAQKKATFAILAVRASDGKILYSRNSTERLIPASNMKLISGASAIHYLGPDYTFKTKIGLLDNNLVVIGGGDPMLGDEKNDAKYGRKPGWVMDLIVDILKQNQITSVENIIIDASIFDSNRVHLSWPQDQLNQWYACETSGLNYNDNCIRIEAEKKNGRAVLSVIPSTTYVNLINQIRLVSRGSSALGAYRNSVANTLIIKGNLNTQTGFDVAIENPAAFFAWHLRESLNQAGIQVAGGLMEKYVKNQKDLRILHTFETPIWDVLARMNKDSLGLAAECLVKTISAENTQGQINGEWAHGLSLMGRYLESLKTDPNDFVLDDGSGLSRKNRLSPAIIVSVLRDIYIGPRWSEFEATLSIGGEEGTTAKYFQNPRYKGRILAKTGYIAGVRALSGICKSPSGDILFSILTEHGNGLTRSAINDITECIFDGKF